MTSPAFDLSLEGSILSYARWLDNTNGSNPGTDALVVEWSTDGSSWNTLKTTFGPANAGGGWLRPEFVVGQDLPASSSMQLRFTVGDDDVLPSVVEAASMTFAWFGMSVTTRPLKVMSTAMAW